jgi:G3E family GTPase
MVRLAVVNTFQQVDRILIDVTGFADPQAYRLPWSGFIGDFLTVVACLLLMSVSTHLGLMGGGY